MMACLHPNLHFGSGDYHLFCYDCNQTWTVMDHAKANQGEATQLSGHLRSASTAGRGEVAHPVFTQQESVKVTLATLRNPGPHTRRYSKFLSETADLIECLAASRASPPAAETAGVRTVRFDDVICQDISGGCGWPECDCPKKPKGGFACPICGKDTPHFHPPKDKEPECSGCMVETCEDCFDQDEIAKLKASDDLATPTDTSKFEGPKLRGPMKEAMESQKSMWPDDKPRDPAMTAQEQRARQIELRQGYRLELWRIRGQAARAARLPRQLPALQRTMTAEFCAAVTAAWLAGYDGKDLGR